MLELYQKDSYRKSIETKVVEVVTVRKKPALCFEENILYPGGGGQPADKGFVTLASGKRVAVALMVKMNRRVYAGLAEAAEVAAGDEVKIEIDWQRRYRNMRYHTAAHVLMAVVKRHVEGYEAKGIDIKEDGSGAAVEFTGTWEAGEAAAREFIAEANAIIAEGREVFTKEYESLADAIRENAGIYRGPTELKGPVSIILISGYDANPCGGTHLSNVREIGRIAIVDCGAERIGFVLTP
jgi:alanyl-tRNA synthetase